jgi:hypothetical protein
LLVKASFVGFAELPGALVLIPLQLLVDWLVNGAAKLLALGPQMLLRFGRVGSLAITAVCFALAVPLWLKGEKLQKTAGKFPQ